LETKYCDATCQKNHWPKHKKQCKLRAAELWDEALFKVSPAKEECPICFLPMPAKLIYCVSLPPATRSSVPIYDFVKANEELANKDMDVYYPCCGKTICQGCKHSFRESGNSGKCPFCNSEGGNTDEERVEQIMKRVEANDAASICMLAHHYHLGLRGVQQDQAKAMELYGRAAELGNTKAHRGLGGIYHQRGDMKKAKFHFEVAAMAGDEVARFNIGVGEAQSGNMERAIKHFIIAASAGESRSMHNLIKLFEGGAVSRESIDSILAAYNSSCKEMRSEARDAAIQLETDTI
jgi:TPR repeat protein